MDFLRLGDGARVAFEERQKVTRTESGTNAVWDCKRQFLRCSSTAKTLCTFICLLNYSSLKGHLDQGFSNLLEARASFNGQINFTDPFSTDLFSEHIPAI